MARSRVNFILLYCIHSVTHSANNRLPIEEQILQFVPNIMGIHSIVSETNSRRTRTEQKRHPIPCSTCALRSRNVLVASKIKQAAMKRQQQLRSCLYNPVNQSGDKRRILPGNHRTYISIDLVGQSIARIIDPIFVISVACKILSNTVIPTIFRRRNGRFVKRSSIIQFSVPGLQIQSHLNRIISLRYVSLNTSSTVSPSLFRFT